MKLNFIIYTNEEFEEEKALVKLEEDNNFTVVVKGDYYHDKIDQLIEGFLMGLKFTRENDYEIENKVINHKDTLFQELDFNQEDYDDEFYDDDED